MSKLHSLLLALVCCLLSFQATSQQKFALLVGINKYYQRPGVPFPTELQGCVNDALALKGMLKQRFGFEENNITTLLDNQATKETVLAALNSILNKSHSGDAVLFYFSGHGVWMSNNDQAPIDREIKEGMNQAMVMSDLYADNLGCLFTDALVKKMFNKFVDKKVVATTIFDCCFSGKLVAMPNFFNRNPYYDKEEFYPEKSINFADIYDNYYQYHTEFDHNFSPRSFNNSVKMALLREDENFEHDSTRSFNLKDNLTVNSRLVITRPYERTNSMFLSLAGTDDREKGLEITDEMGTHHGAYTKALLSVIEHNPSDLSIRELVKQVEAKMKKQMYQQSPMNLQDPNRLNGNLIGIAPNNFSNKITARCATGNGRGMILDAGYYAGVKPGNIFTLIKNGSPIKMEAFGVAADSTFGRLLKGSIDMIKPDDLFTISDTYTKSQPLVKIFINSSNITAAALEEIVAKKVTPLSKLSNYWDYQNFYDTASFRNVFYNDSKSNAESIASNLLSGKWRENFLVFIPIPDFVAKPLKAKLQKNQNIQLVKTAAEADAELFLNYAMLGKDIKEPGYIFTYYQFKGVDAGLYQLRFSAQKIKLTSLQLNAAALKKLTADLTNLTVIEARKKSSRWLNESERR